MAIIHRLFVIRPVVSTIVLTTLVSPARGEIQVFSDIDSWSEAISDDFTTITFAELGGGEFLDDQYSHLGVFFPEDDDHTEAAGGFKNDGWGASGFGATITVDFVTDVSWVGIHFPGLMRIQLYQDEQLIDETGLALGHAFRGVVSSEPFDRVVFLDPVGSVNIDDLHIPVIPGPGTMVLLCVAMAMRSSRQRSY